MARVVASHAEDIDKEDITGAILFLIEQYRASPKNINAGRCDDFASDIAELVPEANYTCTDQFEEFYEDEGKLSSHCWVEFRDRYYDAETPEGVDDWHDLPFFLRDAESCTSPSLFRRRPPRSTRVRSYRRRR